VEPVQGAAQITTLLQSASSLGPLDLPRREEFQEKLVTVHLFGRHKFCGTAPEDSVCCDPHQRHNRASGLFPLDQLGGDLGFQVNLNAQFPELRDHVFDEHIQVFGFGSSAAATGISPPR
jgi:hypothetical protein